MKAKQRLNTAIMGALLRNQGTLHLGAKQEQVQDIAHEQRNKFVCLLTAEQLRTALKNNSGSVFAASIDEFTLDTIETYEDNCFLDVTCIGDKLCYYLRDKKTFVCAPLHLKTGSIKNVLLSMGLDLETANVFVAHFRSCKDAVRNPQFFDLTKC